MLQMIGGSLLIGSAVFGAPGIGLRVVGALQNDAQPISAIGGSFIVISGVSLVTGAVLLGIGNAKAKNTAAPAETAALPPARYPSAQEILCTKPPITPPWLQMAAGPGPAVDPGSTTYQFNEQTAGAADPERERRERLVGSAAQDFVGELNKLTSAAAGG